ncbi:hypothetical protein [Streptomyces lancefieldiae]|uniref:Secreted protein n=1 Tax=Streptomyces lancefieldiae TaxID=3075520 RepID=A0ABU3B0D7_9ACTN|nr:hypothetical protein [Streptomyces sp. DSM 40712]MDT0615912.1 hypothetical protein [Streptomyces sp. DSM 40712]
MPKPIRKSRLTWVVAWVVLCAAGTAATAELNASVPDPQPAKSVSAECAGYIADIETQLAKASQAGMGDGVPAFTRSKVGADDCGDEMRDRFRGDR